MSTVPVDVQRWLDELGLRAYGPAFARNDIDGETLPTLTHADLKALGVASLGHRKKLLAAIAGLRGRPASHDPGPLAEPEGERKLVTVLFADIVGSTDLVWLAARMEQSATSGTVRITPGTLHLCQSLVDVEALGPVQAKGFPDPVDAYRLLAAQRERRTESRTIPSWLR